MILSLLADLSISHLYLVLANPCIFLTLAGIAQIIGFIGLLELGFGYQEKNIEDECNMRMESFGWEAETQRKKKAIELNNGRAAQMGILALMVHEKLDNNPYIINSLFGAPVPFNQ